jgi:cyclic pyranopterin monophosphate synthase
MSDLTHFDDTGASRMVDVGDKPVTRRLARASGRVQMAAETLARIRDQNVAGTLRVPQPASQIRKGDVLEVARLAGIMAAKRTADLIPLCHPLPLESVTIDFSFPDENTLRIDAVAQVDGKTGVEMEALTAVSVAALTVYDMCKSVDRGMTIEQIQLEEKSGGRSGHWRRG